MGANISFYLHATKETSAETFRECYNTRNDGLRTKVSGVFKMFSSIRVIPSKDDTISFAFNEAKQRDHINPLRP